MTTNDFMTVFKIIYIHWLSCLARFLIFIGSHVWQLVNEKRIRPVGD